MLVHYGTLQPDVTSPRQYTYTVWPSFTKASVLREELAKIISAGDNDQEETDFKARDTSHNDTLEMQGTAYDELSRWVIIGPIESPQRIILWFVTGLGILSNASSFAGGDNVSMVK